MNIKWQEGAPAPVKDAFHTAVLCNGKVYIGGGSISSDRIDIYTPANNSWSPSPIKLSYGYFAMTTLNNQLITAGGMDRSHKVTSKIFSLDGNHLKEFTNMITPRRSATDAGYCKILIITGGVDGKGSTLVSTELFDSSKGQWYNTGDLPSPHYGLQSVIVDNTVYLLGGADAGHSYSKKVFSASLDNLYNHHLKWIIQNDTPGHSSAPVSIQGKHLLTVGGVKENKATRDIHMFNKVSHHWEVIGQTNSGRQGPAAVSVADTKIVVVGGEDNSILNTNTVWIGLLEPL